jgi:hypothetical protein
MKKLLIVALCLWTAIGIQKTQAYSTTGHEGIMAVSFEEEGELLVDMSSAQIEAGYKALGKNRFFGWKYHFFNIKSSATYLGEIIFARSNRTNDRLEIDYQMKETNYSERSIKTTGTLSGQFEGNIKKIDAGLKAGGEIELDRTTSITRVEDTKFSFVVDPNHRITFRVTGDAVITNGVSKYCFMGITFKKGTWEYIDIITRYYELVEEELS